MASASRALLLSWLSPLPAAGSRFLRPLAAAGSLLPAVLVPSPVAVARRFATQPAHSSLRDSSPNWSNRPPKETILLDGCDFEHWLVVMEPPPGDGANPDIPRDEIIDSYIKTLAQVVGSEEEARMKIYSVSTRHYFAFGALVSEELSYKLKELPKVRWVLPDSYLDVRNKDYGAVPYDPKYHEEWVINNRRANEPRHKRGDRPRNFDKRRENTHTKAGLLHQPHAANRQSGYVPAGGPNYQNTPHPGYQGAPTPGYQAGNQGNHGGNMHGGPSPAYLSNNPGYQGGGPGGNPSPPSPDGNNPPYQGVGPSYGGGAQGYQNISYQEGSGNYNNAAPPTYEGRDGPGRHYQ
ncbi:hypothetical protein VPH35_084233 [Triticum aestivum]